MLLLTTTTDVIQIVTGSATTLDVHASWVDNAAGTITPGRTNTEITTATTTTVVGSPAASTQRNVQTMLITNLNGSATTVSIQLFDSTSALTATLFSVSLLPNYTIQFASGNGFTVFNSSGVILSAGATGAAGADGRDGISIPSMPGENGEDAQVVPGPKGDAGPAGANGAIGREGTGIPGMDGEDGEASMPIPGPRGNAGTNGTNGITVVMEPELPDDPLVIPGPAGASGTPAANSVTRAMLSSTAVTGGKNWVFLGQGTASGATSTGTITWTGQFRQLMVQYYINGYAGSGIGRICVANSGTPSTTATTCCTALVQTTTSNVTSVSCSGWPTAVTLNALIRHGWMFITNQSGVVKRMTGHGEWGGTAPITPPTALTMNGLSSQTTLIQTLNMISYNAITVNTLGATFNAGTFVNVWGRDDD